MELSTTVNGCTRGNLLQSLPGVLKGLSVNELPEKGIEAAMLGLHL